MLRLPVMNGHCRRNLFADLSLILSLQGFVNVRGIGLRGRCGSSGGGTRGRHVLRCRRSRVRGSDHHRAASPLTTLPPVGPFQHLGFTVLPLLFLSSSSSFASSCCKSLSLSLLYALESEKPSDGLHRLSFSADSDLCALVGERCSKRSEARKKIVLSPTKAWPRPRFPLSRSARAEDGDGDTVSSPLLFRSHPPTSRRDRTKDGTLGLPPLLSFLSLPRKVSTLNLYDFKSLIKGK